MITTFNSLGILHSINDQPSLVDNDGNKYWHIDGKLKRLGNLPCIEYSNGDKRYSLEKGCYKTIEKIYKTIYEKYYNSYGKLHRLDGPALILNNKNGNIINEIFFINGKRHRLYSQPSNTCYENDNIKYEEYCVDEKQNELDNLAEILHCDNDIKSEKYCINYKKLF